MDGIVLLIASALFVGLGALVVLLWSITAGQYDDLDGDAQRILIADPKDESGG